MDEGVFPMAVSLRRFGVILAGLAVMAAMVVTTGVAAAKTVTVTAGAGSSLNCSITGTGKLSPGLADDWVQTDHASDPVAAVAALANETYGPTGPITTTFKGSGTCTGTVTDGTHTVSVSAIKFTITNDPSSAGNTTEQTCNSLTAGSVTTGSMYNASIAYTAQTGYKVTPTTVTGQSISPSTFTLTGGTVTGSFASGNDTTTGQLDATTTSAIAQAPPTSASPTPTFAPCQPTLQVKTTKRTGTTAALKAPKGLKKFSLVSGSTLALMDSGTLTGVSKLVSHGDAADGGGYCAVLTSGGVDCWGVDNGSSAGDSNAPVAVEGVGGIGTLGGVSNVVSGGNSYCALLTSGGVDCWGADNGGALGDGNTAGGSRTPVQVVGVGGTGTLTGVQSLAGASESYCALLNAGGVDCWGGDNAGTGVLGDGSTANSGTPVQVFGVGGTGTLSGVASLVSDGSSSNGSGFCALLTTKNVDCWGANNAGELGDGGLEAYDTTPQSVVGTGGSGTLGNVANLVNYGDGLGFCALLTSQTVDCWGDNGSAELGNGTIGEKSAIPGSVLVPSGDSYTPLQGVTSVASDQSGAICALLTSGNVDCWGNFTYGEVGAGIYSGLDPPELPLDGYPTPLAVEGVGGTGTLNGVVSVTGSSGSFAFCARLSSGGVDCWGIGVYGDLGDGVSYTNPDTGPGSGSPVPVVVVGVGGTGTLSNVANLVGDNAGGATYCALLTSGSVDCWGNGFSGQLGNGTNGTYFPVAGAYGSDFPVAVEQATS